MKAIDILEQLEKVSGSIAKQKILKENSNNPELRYLLDAALNFKRKFFVKKFDVPKGICRPGDGSFVAFLALLGKLERRELTGHAAIQEVEGLLTACTSILDQKWYTRVLRKDLKIGIDISTVNKCGFDIPDFEVQLAKDGRKASNLYALLKKGCFVSPKLDGYRCIAVIENGEATLYSRNGTIYENFPSIQNTLSSLFDAASSFVLDGEIMSDNFNSMQQSAFASKRGTTVGDVVYHVFDMIPIEEWNTDIFTRTAAQRYEDLSAIFSIIPKNTTNLVMVPHTLVHDLPAVLDAEEKYVAAGYEGAMVNPNIPYYRGKKSNKMLKFKTFQSMEGKVITCYEGSADSKYVGTLGGITVLQENGVQCDVGSGFSDEERNTIWRNQTQVIGRTMEIKYQELTPDLRMRFPVFKRWRTDKD
jgi:DNA ligase 1